MNSIDVILLIFMVASALLAAKRGLLLSLLNLGAVVLSGILSKICAAPVSALVYNYLLHETVSSKLYEILPEGSLSGQIGAGLESVLSELPKPLIAIAKQFNLYPDLSASGTQVLTVEGIEEDYIMPLIIGILTILATIVLFVLFSILLRLIARMIDHKATNKKDHKHIHRSNALLGGLVGLVRSVIPAGVICVVLNLIAPATGSSTLAALVDNSYFCGIIAKILG